MRENSIGLDLNDLNKWIEGWNENMTVWHQDPDAFVAADPWWRVYKWTTTKLVKDSLPEPYLGNAHNCCAVILNYNPRERREWQGKLDGKLVNEAVRSYSCFAKGFIYLDETSEFYSDWWRLRYKWIKRLQCAAERKSELLPFAMELCYWRTPEGRAKWKGFCDYGEPKLHQHLIDNVFFIAEQVAMNATLPRCILCVGPVFGKLFGHLEHSGFSMFRNFDWKDHSGISQDDWPQKGGWPVERSYSIWLHDNCCYLQTESQGGNPAPSEKWEPVERCLLQLISRLLSSL